MPLPRRTTGVLAAGLVLSLTQLPTTPATGAPTPSSPRVAVDADDFRGLGDSPLGLEDLDARGVALPTAAQRTAARGLGATVRWNSFGTPSSILPEDGSLGAATGEAPAAARSWLRRNASVLGLTTAEVDALELVNNQRLAQTSARAVLFRQRFTGPGGDLAPALDSMVTVGVANGRIAYVSSSLTKNADPVPAPVLTEALGWVKAADAVGLDVPVGDLLAVDTPASDWATFEVDGLAQDQLARIRSLAMADGDVRPVVEANVVDVDGNSLEAYTVMVDAVTGEVLHREHQVEQSNESSGFQGEISADECGPQHPFDVTDDTTKEIVATATAVIASNDLVVKILDPEDEVLTSGDLLTSPETATYTAPNGGTLEQGTYSVQVCPFDAPTAPFTDPGTYAGTVSLSESSGGTPALPYPPKWRYFDTNPTPKFGTEHTPTNSVVGCWVVRNGGAKVPGCTEPVGQLYNLASRVPWDVNTNSSLSTLTTEGNNARDREAWASPLTPGGLFQAPVSPTREYTDEFTDAWNNSKCDPAQLVPGGNDIFASVTNLFVAHNRMHDYSYYLGFTEKNYNLQQDNFGNAGAAGDPEIGNVQAGALTGGTPSYLGRDNANQIALQDGVPGITNQYLFQPIAGAFYAPCTDGGMDMGIVGHEYTHAISNRMVGGPDQGLTSEQGGAMGESWSDLVAGEFQFAHNYDNGGNIWAIGLYATGNKKVAIRDYAINANPLTYGEYGFDTTGDEVHADGEIWNATQWRVRQALVEKHNRRYPYTDKVRQFRCSESRSFKSPIRATDCPGNRRWISLMFDSFLLQQGATSMLDARDAMLAADRMRFGGNNQAAMWKAFARSGMGVGASTPNADSGDVEPSFATPSGNTDVRFRPVLADGTPVKGQVFIGTYEARATPLADTLGSTDRDAEAPMAPGTYRGLVQSAETGLTRFTATVGRGGSQTVRITVEPNLAAKASGASVLAASAGSLNAESLIDSTEGSNWAGVNEGGENVDEKQPFVDVDLAGGRSTIRRLVVSAMLRPADTEGGDVPLAQVDEDPDSGSRFTALRRFAIEVCAAGCAADDATWTRVYTSSPDAFPGERPRPTAPKLNARTFRIDPVQARAVRLVALENQCTGFAGYAGEQDNDPLNDTDCKTASDRGQSVRAAELEVFSR